MLARMKQTIKTCALPDVVCGEIRRIINSRWQEFFITGPTDSLPMLKGLSLSRSRSVLTKALSSGGGVMKEATMAVSLPRVLSFPW